MSAPVGSPRWELGLRATMAVAALIAVCPVWWAVAACWDLKDRLASR